MAKTEQATTSGSHHRPDRLTIWAFYVGTFFYWGALYVYSPILSVYAESLGATFTLIGIVVGTYGLVQMLLRIPLGVLSDRWGRRLPFLYAGHFFNFVGCLGLALAPTATYLAVFRGVLGISAATWVAFTVLYASYFPADETPKAMGIMSAINGVSLIVVNLAGGQIAESWGMVATFYAGAGLAVIGLISTVPIKEKRVTRTPPTVRQIWRVMTHPALLIAASGHGTQPLRLLGTTSASFRSTPTTSAQSKFTLGIIGVVSLVPYTLASLVNHRFAQRLGDNWAVFAGMMIMAATTFVVPLIHDVPLLAASQGINGIGRGIVYPLLMGLSIREISSEDRATAMGVFQAVYAIGMFLGPMTAGAVADLLGLGGAFILSGCVSVLAALAALALIKKKAPAAA